MSTKEELLHVAAEHARQGTVERVVPLLRRRVMTTTIAYNDGRKLNVEARFSGWWWPGKLVAAALRVDQPEVGRTAMLLTPRTPDALVEGFGDLFLPPKE